MSEAKRNDAQTKLYEAQAAEIGFKTGHAAGSAGEGLPGQDTGEEQPLAA
jgi:hypothetical protein